MKNLKEIGKVLEGDKPINGMYNLIPKNKIAKFKEFAKKFGYTEDKINSILQSEK